MFAVKKISKSFGGKVVLKDCSFDVPENKIVSLVGPNGCGKTTLFNIANRILDVDSGKIVYKKKNLCQLSTSQIANLGIVRTFQEPQLFKNLTVWEHVVLSVKDNSGLLRNIFGMNKLNVDEIRRIDFVLKSLELDKKRDSKPNELSGGQRKLLDLAVVLVKEFDLILLDEPLAGVSPYLRDLIAKIIVRLKKENKTVFLIEHDMDFVMSVSDEIIVLNNGNVLKRGKPAEIKSDERVLKAYLGG